MNPEAKSWLTPDGVMAAGTIVSIVGAAIGAYFIAPLREKIKAMEDAEEKKERAAKEAREKWETAISDRIRALHDDHAGKIHDLEIKNAEIEKTYLSRAEHLQYRAEIMAAVEKINATVLASCAAIREDIHELGERVARVEASA